MGLGEAAARNEPLQAAPPPQGRDPARKVAIFLQDLAGGGAERMMLQLADGMADRGVSVDLLLVRAKGPYLSAVPSKIRVIDLRRRRTWHSIWSVMRYLRRERPSALLSALVHVNVAAILAARLAGRKTLVIASERNTISKNVTAVSSPANWLAHRLVPWLYPWADGIVAVSRGVAEDLARYSGVSLDRVDIVNNPVVTPELYNLANESVDHPWFGRGNTPVVLGVGRLVPQKDFGTLVKAFAKVRTHRAARLMIVGEGPERDELEHLGRELGVYDDFSLPGFCRNPYALMARSAVLVLSSRWEGSPNVLVEAMACGTPVVSTNCPHGPAETLQGGRFGPLVPVGDASALAAAIAKTLDNPLAAERLRQRARDFTVEHSVEHYLQILFRKVNS